AMIVIVVRMGRVCASSSGIKLGRNEAVVMLRSYAAPNACPVHATRRFAQARVCGGRTTTLAK
ncbi:MAG TPA: hypothetical protein VFX59_17860, partial [Polyangiales bacterium]|nr:hypothetical protein [Polyangiales bacterium]